MTQELLAHLPEWARCWWDRCTAARQDDASGEVTLRAKELGQLLTALAEARMDYERGRACQCNG